MRTDDHPERRMNRMPVAGAGQNRGDLANLDDLRHEGCDEHENRQQDFQLTLHEHHPPLCSDLRGEMG